MNLSYSRIHVSSNLSNIHCYLYEKGNKYLQIYMILKQPPGVLQEKVFLKILQYSQENTCARDSFLIQLQAPGLQLY